MNVAHVVVVACVAGGIVFVRDCMREELDSRGLARTAS